MCVESIKTVMYNQITVHRNDVLLIYGEASLSKKSKKVLTTNAVWLFEVFSDIKNNFRYSCEINFLDLKNETLTQKI